MKNLLLFAFAGSLILTSCATTGPTLSSSSGRATTFRFEKLLPVGEAAQNILVPVSVVGATSAADRIVDGLADEFRVTVANASTIVKSENGNGMGNAEVADKKGKLILTWWEIGDTFCTVTITYQNGALSQSKIITESRGM